MLHSSQKPVLVPALNALFAMLPLLPHQTDVRLSGMPTNGHSVVFVTTIIPPHLTSIRFGPEHVQMFMLHVKNVKKKLKLTAIVCIHNL